MTSFIKSLLEDYTYSELREINKKQSQFDKFIIKHPKVLKLGATQKFVSRLMRPSSKERKLLLKMGTGTGKTLTALIASNNFKQYKKIVLGFTQNIFKNEMLKIPELGYITYEEKYELEELYIIAKTGNEFDKQKYQEYKNKIRRRINADYTFYGYREFANSLFMVKASNISNDDANNSFEDIDFEKYVKLGSVEVINKMLDDGIIELNKPLLESFRNTLLICDEIHMTYNSETKNNYGFAIQYVLDYLKNDIYVLFLSATIMTNSPREIIDIANMLRNSNDKYILSKDFFKCVKTNIKDGKKINTTCNENTDIDDDIIKFDFNKLSKIINIFRNKVIFLEESGEDYPTFSYEGISVKGIDYLKFTTFKLPQLLKNTIKATPYTNFSIQMGDAGLMDMCFPNPEYSTINFNKLTETTIKSKNIIGLHHEVFEKINSAPLSWRQKNLINVDGKKDDYDIDGDFLRKENLQRYSIKYYELLELLDRILSKTPKIKILIYHPYVNKTGVKTVANILSRNGYLDEYSQAVGETFDSKTHKRKSEFKNLVEFTPSRYMLIHHKVADGEVEKKLQTFNHSSNDYGEHYQIMIGSQKIKQSIHFDSVSVIIIMQFPKTIPLYIQVRGRVIRKHSMSRLPENKRHVKIYTLFYSNSIEEELYRKKMKVFKQIQYIDREINRNALNNYIWNSGEYISNDPLTALTFENKELKSILKTKSLSDNTESYYAYAFYKETMREVMILIKSAFVNISCWKYVDLFEYVKSKGNPNLIENIFKLALSNLLFDEESTIIEQGVDEYNYMFYNYFNHIINFDKFGQTEERCLIMVNDYIFLALYRNGYPIIKPNIFLYKNTEGSNINIYLNDEKQYAKFLLMYENLAKKYDLKANPYILLRKYDNSFQEFILKSIITETIKIPIECKKLYEGLKLLGSDWFIVRNMYKYINGNWTKIYFERKKRIENDEFIGIINSEGKFKIRKSRFKYDESDLRTLEKGINCKSLQAKTLSAVIKYLGGITNTNMKRSSICELLFKRFVDLEINELNGRNEYIYLRFRE